MALSAKINAFGVWQRRTTQTREFGVVTLAQIACIGVL